MADPKPPDDEDELVSFIPMIVRFGTCTCPKCGAELVVRLEPNEAKPGSITSLPPRK